MAIVVFQETVLTIAEARRWLAEKSCPPPTSPSGTRLPFEPRKEPAQ